MKYFVILAGLLLAGCGNGVTEANSEGSAHNALRQACVWKTMRYTFVELDNIITYTVTCERQR